MLPCCRAAAHMVSHTWAETAAQQLQVNRHRADKPQLPRSNAAAAKNPCKPLQDTAQLLERGQACQAVTCSAGPVRASATVSVKVGHGRLCGLPPSWWRGWPLLVQRLRTQAGA